MFVPVAQTQGTAGLSPTMPAEDDRLKKLKRVKALMLLYKFQQQRTAQPMTFRDKKTQVMDKMTQLQTGQPAFSAELPSSTAVTGAFPGDQITRQPLSGIEREKSYWEKVAEATPESASNLLYEFGTGELNRLGRQALQVGRMGYDFFSALGRGDPNEIMEIRQRGIELGKEPIKETAGMVKGVAWLATHPGAWKEQFKDDPVGTAALVGMIFAGGRALWKRYGITPAQAKRMKVELDAAVSDIQDVALQKMVRQAQSDVKQLPGATGKGVEAGPTTRVTKETPIIGEGFVAKEKPSRSRIKPEQEARFVELPKHQMEFARALERQAAVKASPTYVTGPKPRRMETIGKGKFRPTKETAKPAPAKLVAELEAGKLNETINKQISDFEKRQAPIVKMGLGPQLFKERRPTTRTTGQHSKTTVEGPPGEVRNFFARTEKTPKLNLLKRVTGDLKEKFVFFSKLQGKQKIGSKTKTEFFAEATEQLRQTVEIPRAAADKSFRAMRAVVGELDRPQYEILRRRVFVEDLLQTTTEGKKIPGGLTAENLSTELQRIKQVFAKDEGLRDAWGRHGQFRNAIRDELIDRGKLDPEFAREHYTPHEVVDYLNENLSGVGRKLRKPYREYLRQRKGSEKDILTDYLAVWYRHVYKVMRDNAIEDRLFTIAKKYHDPKATTGYVKWQPAPGNVHYGGKTIPDKIIGQIQNEIITDAVKVIPELKDALIVGGKRKTWNIPEPLAATLDNFKAEYGTIESGLMTGATSKWKQFVLNKNPVRYNRRNFLGDSERAINATPEAFGRGSPATFKRVVQDMNNARKGIYSKDYQMAVDKGVAGSGQISYEVGRIKEMSEFANIVEKSPGNMTHLLATAGRHLRNFTTARENLLRLHVFYSNLDRMRAGTNMFTGVSRVKGITDKADIAAKVSREALGDYGKFTSWENKTFRNAILPFYSWLKINTTFWPQLVARQGIKGAAKTPVKMATKTGVIIAKANALYIAASLWNNTVQNEQEEELPDYVRERFHFNTGLKDSKGKWITFTEPTALADFMDTFGLNGVDVEVRALLKGQLSLWDFTKERAAKVLTEPAKAVAQRVTPFIKAPFSTATKRKFFPEPFKPRPSSASRLEIFVDEMGAGEFTSTRDIKTWLDSMFGLGAPGLKRHNIMGGALSDITSKAIEFKESKGYKAEGTGPNTKYNRAILNAVIYKEPEKLQEALKDAASHGVTGKSLQAYIKARDPYSIVSKKYIIEFAGTLNERDKKRFLRVHKFLRKLYRKK